MRCLSNWPAVALAAMVLAVWCSLASAKGPKGGPGHGAGRMHGAIGHSGAGHSPHGSFQRGSPHHGPHHGRSAHHRGNVGFSLQLGPFDFFWPGYSPYATHYFGGYGPYYDYDYGSAVPYGYRGSFPYDYGGGPRPLYAPGGPVEGRDPLESSIDAQREAAERAQRDSQDANLFRPDAYGKAPIDRPHRQAALLLSAGDELFSDLRYAEAATSYAAAARVASEWAEARFRQGFALLAAGRYGEASRAIREGLARDPNWPRSSWRLDGLYRRSGSEKSSHLGALADAALAQKDDADLLFLLGVFLHADGQQSRGRKFFEKASQLAGPNAEHVRPFLTTNSPPPKATTNSDRGASF